MSHEAKLKALSHVVRRLSSYPNRESVLEALVFLEIALEQGCTSRHIQDSLGIDQSTVSRETRALGDGYGRHKRKKLWKGRDLVYGYPDPQDPRRYRFCLTENGEALRDEVLADLVSALCPMRQAV